jgi:hypothetical protein
MKKIIGVFMVGMVFSMGFGLMVQSQVFASENKPLVEVAGPVKMDKKAKVTINGKGFRPGQEVIILLTDKNGVKTDIGYALKPAPKADDSGVWTTTWSCGRFISKKLVKKGEHRLTVTDSDYNPLAHGTVSFSK